MAHPRGPMGSNAVVPRLKATQLKTTLLNYVVSIRQVSNHRADLISANATALLYCHNRWLGVCHKDVLRSRQHWMRSMLDPSGRPVLLSPALAGRMLALMQKNVSNGRSSKATRSPSTGMVAIAAALKMCASVRVYGFDDPNMRGGCQYYFDCSHSQEEYYRGRRDHDWRRQWAALQTLTAQGAVKRGGPSPASPGLRIRKRSEA
jgi:hypothetical protein|uniref:Uncharacterized protein n=1 Tax=Haptolina ericina TaxID=156174 RepID=A0A7S3FFA6_9EUKA|mmetsp:Transcript_68300/g.152450  ORF Transcript_68300/g.152450 Transcript_68300/m.152450 type:complete len:205 (+) Transcript_68300:391-1005(+)